LRDFQICLLSDKRGAHLINLTIGSVVIMQIKALGVKRQVAKLEGVTQSWWIGKLQSDVWWHGYAFSVS
ncbi:hypothetical protein, partial [Enterobacter hormaechei]